MKFVKLKKASKREIYESKSNAFLMLLAFLCAVSAWFAISITVYPSETKTLTHIPLILETAGTTAGENNLKVIGKENYTS